MYCVQYWVFLFCVVSQLYYTSCQDTAKLSEAYRHHAHAPKLCTLHSGQKGVCRKVSQCPSLSKNSGFKGWWKRLHCGFKWFKPLVCCPEEVAKPVFKTPSVVVKEAPVKPDLNFACGISPTIGHNRFRRDVVGGEETAVGQYPWMAVIGSRVNQDITWQCDGVFIHPEWVLSAVHCFLENSTYVVRLGEHDINSVSDGASPLDFLTAEIIFHPDFKIDVGYHDLALLKLEKQVPISKSIMPICLPSSDKSSLVGKSATLAGWGAEEFGGSLSDVLRDAKVTIFNTSVCDKSYSELPDYETLWPQGITKDNIICAGNINGGIDACQGDSGGPLMLEMDNKYTLIGIVAKGFGCGLEDFPGIYIDVRSYLKWIRDMVFKNK